MGTPPPLTDSVTPKNLSAELCNAGNASMHVRMVDRMVTGRLSTKLLKVCGIYAEYALFTRM
jgi:hypothetical protein